MLNSTAKLAFYNARNRRGDATRIREKFKTVYVKKNKFSFEVKTEYDYSLSHICNVLSGRRNNKQILNKAYRLSYRRMKNSQLAK
jgi:hypothetical protein